MESPWGSTGAAGSSASRGWKASTAPLARHPDGHAGEPESVFIVGDETNDVTITLPSQAQAQEGPVREAWMRSSGCTVFQ